MKKTAFDSDNILSEFLSDYLDDNLDGTECVVFEEYLENNDKEREFAHKARLGKQALSSLAGKIKSAEDFEAKLALRLAVEKEIVESV